MDQHTATKRIAIVGLGPRGLGALETLAEVADGLAITIDVFDPQPDDAAGPNFAPDDSPICLLNIPLRDIAIRAPDFSTCGGFADWLPHPFSPDAFPTRAELGRYLNARFADLKAQTSLHLTAHQTEITGLSRSGAGWTLKAKDRTFGPYDEILLTLGQPAVHPDPQWAGWQEQAPDTDAQLAQAYPAKRLIAKAAQWTGRTVAIRGLALSAFDVLRALTLEQGGRFEDGTYHPSGREPARILPFSLDGMPPFPKPGTEALDDRFTPTDAETAAFEKAIAAAATATPAAAQTALTQAILPAATRVLGECGGDAVPDHVHGWLNTEWTTPGDQEQGGPLDILRLGIAMGSGAMPPSIGYVIGQIWRKWQDPLRAHFNPADTLPETAQKIVGFDEGLKRYSYGPPLSSSVELSILIEAGLVDLALARDPGIEMGKDGWTLRHDGQQDHVSVMIDAVMPSPDPGTICTPLMQGLVAQGRIAAMAEKLAAKTDAEGQLIGADGAPQKGLCLLGRLALGSVIAADSLHDCFGASGDRWAQGLVRRAGLST